MESRGTSRYQTTSRGARAGARARSRSSEGRACRPSRRVRGRRGSVVAVARARRTDAPRARGRTLRGRSRVVLPDSPRRKDRPSGAPHRGRARRAHLCHAGSLRYRRHWRARERSRRASARASWPTRTRAPPGSSSLRPRATEAPAGRARPRTRSSRTAGGSQPGSQSAPRIRHRAARALSRTLTRTERSHVHRDDTDRRVRLP